MERTGPSASGEYPGTAIATVVFGLIGAVGLFALAWLLADDARHRYINLTVSLLGGAIGCSIAVLSSPYSDNDSTQFIKIWKSISVFGSGYLIGKFDKVIEQATKPESILQQTVLLEMAFFTIGFIVVGMGTLASRLYFNQRWRIFQERSQEAVPAVNDPSAGSRNPAAAGPQIGAGPDSAAGPVH